MNLRAISLKIARPDALVWVRDWPDPSGPPTYRLANQLDRDVMQELWVGVVMPQLLVICWTLPKLRSLARGIAGQMSDIWGRLGIGYEGRGFANAKGGVWTIQPSGHHYSIPQYAGEKIAAALVKEPAAVNHPLLTTDLLDVLDLRRLNGKLIAGADFQIGTPPGPKNEAVMARVAQIDTRKRRAEPTGSQQALLEDTHLCHHLVSNWRRGTGPKPTCSVPADHAAFEASTDDLTQRHFFTVCGFIGQEYSQRLGYADGWDDAEVAHWADLQDRFHHRWKDAVEAGDWATARLEDRNHQNAHIGMNLPPSMGAELRFSGYEDDDGDVVWVPTPTRAYIDDCPRITAAEYLLLLTGAASAVAA